MTFKKTITFTATVSDYTAGTVSARVQAENKILADFVAFILAQGLNIQQLEKVSIGDAMWSGAPLNAASGATGVVDNNSLLSDVYFLGKGMTKKCLGLSVDNNILYAGFTDTATHDMTFTQSEGESYGRLPTGQIRHLKESAELTARRATGATIPLATFSNSDDSISMTIAYYKGAGSLVIKRTDSATDTLAIFGDPASVFIYGGTGTYALHYSLTDDVTVDSRTYAIATDNRAYAANAARGYGISMDPAFLHQQNWSPWEAYAVIEHTPTLILMHNPGFLDLTQPADTAANPVNGMAAAASAPAASLYGFPRIMNNELYIKKMYIPMTYPAVTSPVKVGYTPGILYAGTVYQLNGKYYLSLTQGVIGYFIEVADQGA